MVVYLPSLNCISPLVHQRDSPPRPPHFPLSTYPPPTLYAFFSFSMSSSFFQAMEGVHLLTSGRSIGYGWNALSGDARRCGVGFIVLLPMRCDHPLPSPLCPIWFCLPLVMVYVTSSCLCMRLWSLSLICLPVNLPVCLSVCLPLSPSLSSFLFPPPPTAPPPRL